MKKLEGKSQDVLVENVLKIKELFPEVFEEGKINFDYLKKVLGDFVDSENEKYSFTWNGKSDAIKTSLRPTSATLLPNMDSSKNWNETENILIEGDNLDVLKVIQDSYRNKIKMIYIDPPYNTGNDFIYNDNFDESVIDYKERMNESLVSNVNTSGRYHTNWLNMMYPRIRLSRNLLKDNGVFFISIDDHESANLRKICDEIFGEDNFIVQFVWEKHKAPKNDNKYVSENHEYCLMYAKNKENFVINLLPRTEKNLAGFSNPDNDPRGKWTSGPLLAPTFNIKGVFEINKPNGEKILPPKGKCWSFSKNRIEELILDKRIWFGEDGSNVPRIKRFLTELPNGIVPTSVLLHDELSGTQKASNRLKELFNDEKIFTYPKPLEILNRFLILSTNKKNNDIVLDFFAGSSTTAHAVIDLNAEDGGNRRFIMVQLPEKTDKDSEAFKAGYKYISDISMERIRRAGEKIKKDNKDKEGIDKLDIGFKAFKLDSTNLTLWDEKTKDLQGSLLEQVNSVKSDRKVDDVLYEILLKYGIDLSTPITEEKINNKKVYSIAGGYLLICLEKDIDLETISKIAEKKPQRVVFYDHGFKDDMVKINAEQTLKKAGIEDIRII